MSKIFDDILIKGIRTGELPSRTQRARDWYRESAKEYGSRIRGGSGPRAGRKEYARINEKSFVNQDKSRLTVDIKPGQMYMYNYDPKYKDTLPFYDKYPLIFPFRVESDRFWGINLHYLSLPMRASLMDGLYELVNNTRYDATTKLRLSYQALTAASRLRYFKPCVKQYLFSHMRSQFMYIYPSEWDIALFLPLERFEKKTKTQVWSESKKTISGAI